MNVTRNEKKRAHYATHREEIKARSTAYRKTHPEKIKARTAIYNATHREQIKAYRETHREEFKAYRETRREGIKIRYLARAYKVSLYDAKTLILLRDGPSAWCDICRTTSGPFEIDHDHSALLPQSIRGILCRVCNHRLAALDDAGFLDSAFTYLRDRIRAGGVRE